MHLMCQRKYPVGNLSAEIGTKRVFRLESRLLKVTVDAWRRLRCLANTKGEVLHSELGGHPKWEAAGRKRKASSRQRLNHLGREERQDAVFRSSGQGWGNPRLVQRLRLHAPSAGPGVQSLVGELDPPCCTRGHMPQARPRAANRKKRGGWSQQRRSERFQMLSKR